MDGQGKLERTWKVTEKSGNSKNRLWQAVFKKFILFKRVKDVHSHETVLAHLPPHLGLLLKKRICSLGEQILSFKSSPKFEVMQLAPLK